MKDERERLGYVPQGFAAPPEDGFDPIVDLKGREQRNRRIRAGAVGGARRARNGVRPVPVAMVEDSIWSIGSTVPTPA